MVSASESSMADVVKYCYQCGKCVGIFFHIEFFGEAFEELLF